MPKDREAEDTSLHSMLVERTVMEDIDKQGTSDKKTAIERTMVDTALDGLAMPDKRTPV